MNAKVRSFFKRYSKDLIILLVLLIGVEWWQSRHMVKGALPEQLKAAVLPQIKGEQTQLWQTEHDTLVYIFAPWCGVCRGSASNLNGLSTSSLEVKSLALSWEHPDEVRRFVAETGLEGPVLLGGETIAQAMQVTSFPSYYLISSQGEVLRSWSGYTTKLGLWLRSRRL